MFMYCLLASYLLVQAVLSLEIRITGTGIQFRALFLRANLTTTELAKLGI
jgi:hypothetical protein